MLGALLRRSGQWVLLVGLLALALVAPAPVSAQLANDGDSVLQEVNWQLDSEGRISVSAQMVLMLPPSIVNALRQGVPVYFTAQAALTRKRLWLLERTDVRARRFWRLSYQPLTRMWRLQGSSVSSSHTDAAQGLAQHFDSLEQALASMQRLAGWEVGHIGQLKPHQRYAAEFAFGLDQQRLPKPLQFDSLGRSDWELQLRAVRSIAPEQWQRGEGQ